MEINGLVLAYLGDSIYEKYIREFLIQSGISKVKTLQEKATLYVSAKKQCEYMKALLEKQLLTEEEKQIFYRARNHKSHKCPKNTDPSTYKCATGLEAIIGYLYLEKKEQRIDEIMNWITGGSLCISTEKM